MKSTLMGAFLFSMSVSWASAQQAGAQADNSGSAGGAAASRSGPRADVFVSSGRSSTIRIIGAPRNQPNPGRNVECSPAEQSIVGDIIGPTDLCDR
jgi:hypothetical protein